MSTHLTFNEKYTISDMLLEETAYCKDYYLNHPDFDWEDPKVAADYDSFFENSPFSKDEAWQKMRMDYYENYMGDDVLDAYETEVYAMIPPNYFPALWHYHTYYELVYILKGTATNYTSNGTQILKEGDLMILGLGSRHAISSYNDDCIIVNIMVRNATFWEIFSNNTYESDVLYSFFTNVLTHYVKDTFILFHTEKDSLIRSLILSLLEEQQYYHKYSNLERKSAISLLFSRLMNKYASTSELINNDSSEKQYDITMILSYMQQHYKDISLPTLSQFFGYSERQTRRLLQKFTGKGYQENLDSIRMKEAKELLLSTQESIEDIANETGFSSVYSFRKSFKKYYGKTPSEYKKARS